MPIFNAIDMKLYSSKRPLAQEFQHLISVPNVVLHDYLIVSLLVIIAKVLVILGSALDLLSG